MMFLKKYKNLFLLTLLFSSLFSAFKIGVIYEERNQKIDYLERFKDAVSQMEEQRAHDIELMMTGTARKPEIRETIREIRVAVPTPDCSELGPDWMRIANEILATDP